MSAVAAKKAPMANQGGKDKDQDKRGKGRPPTVESTTQLSVRVGGELEEALNQYLASQRPEPSMASILRTAIEDFLASRGFWPPEDD